MGKASRKKFADRASPIADPEPAVPTAHTGDRRPATGDRVWTFALALFLFTCAVFSPAVTHDFINFDDPDYVSANPIVQSGLTAKGIRYAFTSVEPYYWQPLTWLSLQLDATLFGSRPGAHLAVNIVLHAFAVVLLFLLLQRTTGRLWPSLAVAALWAVHPLRVESVAWVAERKDVLSTLLFIATIYVYVRYVEHRTVTRYLAVVAVFILALMSKPMVVMLPLVLLVVDFWPLRVKPAIKDKVPLFILAAVVVSMTFVGQRTAIAEALPLSIRIPNAIINYVAYLGKMVLPIGLAIIYPYRFPIETLKVLTSGVLLVAITAAVFYRRRPALIAGWLWYVITLVPVIGVVQAGAQSIADRFTYIPSIGIFFGIAFGFAWGRIAAVVAGAALVIFTIMTSLYLRTWRDSITLFSHAIAVTKDNPVAQIKLGDSLMAVERIVEANAAYEEAVRASRGGAVPLAAAGGALVRQKRYAEAIEPLRRVVAIDPNNANVRELAGTAMMNSGQAPEAITHFEAALRLDSGVRRAEILHGLGVAKRIAGRVDEGIADVRASINTRPTAEAWNDLGSAYSAKNDIPRAEEAFRQSLRLNPDLYDARMNYSAILNRANRNDEAAAQIREAMRISPNALETRIFLALVLAASGKNSEAAAAASEAMAIDPRQSNEILSRALQLQPAENNIEPFIAKMREPR